MMETADSIRQYGVLVPAIARPSQREAMSLSPDTAATGPVSWPRKRQCRLSSNISDYHGKLCIKSPISVAKKKVMVCYAMAFIIRFRFNAVDDKRHCCSAASNPLLYRNFKLCLAFCVAKLPSLHICRRSKTFACLSVPSFHDSFLRLLQRYLSEFFYPSPFLLCICCAGAFFAHRFRTPVLFCHCICSSVKPVQGKLFFFRGR